MSFHKSRVDQSLILLDISKKRVKRRIAVQRLGRVGDDALQEKPLLDAHRLRDQKAAARVPRTDHPREPRVVFVHGARADLQEEKSQKEN